MNFQSFSCTIYIQDTSDVSKADTMHCPLTLLYQNLGILQQKGQSQSSNELSEIKTTEYYINSLRQNSRYATLFPDQVRQSCRKRFVVKKNLAHSIFCKCFNMFGFRGYFNFCLNEIHSRDSFPKRQITTGQLLIKMYKSKS